ncbi:MAG: YbgC/FadM family acyl-CoA thioesterase, partial [Gammaproteobacteria bacterium]
FANYLRFMERGRTEWLRSRGIEQDALRSDHNLLFSLASTSAKFLRPARFDDSLTVRTRLEKLSGARVVFSQAVHRGDNSEELLCAADCVVACISADQFKPSRIPAGLLDV